MITKTKIDWCDYTWNPVWGCRYACKYCYARKIAKRFYKNVFGKHNTDDYYNFEPAWIESNFNKDFPKNPSIIFVNSMSDIAYWQDDWMEKVLLKIKKYPQHHFLFSTRSPQGYDQYKFPSNCWLGITITNQKQMYDFTSEFCDYLWPEKYNFFFSLEPILEPIIISTTPDWIIIGAETGNRKEKVIPKKKWINNIVTDSKEYKTPVFMKESLREIMGADFIQKFPKELKS